MPPGASAKIHENLVQFVEEYQPEAWTLRGAYVIQPITQGDYDGLCGLYAIINAICLVAAPEKELNHDEVRVLFQAGVTHLARQGKLTRAVHTGIAQEAYLQLAQHVTRAARKRLRIHIMLEQPFGRSSMLAEAGDRKAHHVGQSPDCVHARKVPTLLGDKRIHGVKL